MKNSNLTIVIILLLSFVFNQSIIGQSKKDKSSAPYFQANLANGDLAPMPLLSTSAEVNIAGTIADVIITQVYKNSGDAPLEAIYVFPGSTQAAVYGMEMKIGERTIKAKVKEKGQAKREFVKARKAGKRASLLSQERPNVFQMKVTNILPGDQIEVLLQYTENIVPEEGIYEFVYPTVVGPRFHEKTKTDFPAIPYQKTGLVSEIQFNIDLTLNGGLPIQDISSPSHKINTVYNNPNSAAVSLSCGELNPANRDVVIQYQLSGKKIQSGLLLYEGEEENFFSLTVQPPKKVMIDNVPPREFVFIIDVSGSMRGFPIEITKKLMRNLISNMRLQDKFNILLFSGSTRVLSEESMAATPENIHNAMKFIDEQNGGGSTRLLNAMKKAISLPRCDYNVSRSMVIVTDGYVSVEKEVFDIIRNNLNQTNVYAFGIGSGINRHLIEGIAHVGQGEPLVILSENEAAEKAEKFRNYISTPLLTQVMDSYKGINVYDVEPPTIPDVLSERPIVIYGKYDKNTSGEIKLSGYTGNGHFSTSINTRTVKSDKKNKALKYLWARQSIKRLGDYELFGSNKDEVTRLGLKYNLLTDHTSFIAIDNEPTDHNQQLKEVTQVVPMPANVSNAAIGAEMEIVGVSSHKSLHKKDTIKHIRCQKPKTDTVVKTSKVYKTAGKYESGDHMYVWAPRGYKLRAGPNTRSTVLNLVKFGERLTIIEQHTRVYEDQALPYVDHSFSDDIATPFTIRGHWVKVQNDAGQVGYVIDNYLLSIEPYDKNYASKNEINIKKLRERILQENETYEDGAELYSSEEKHYQHRIQAITEKGSDWNITYYVLEHFTIKEAFVLLTSSWGSLDEYDVLENKENLLIISDRNNCMISFKFAKGKVTISRNCTC